MPGPRRVSIATHSVLKVKHVKVGRMGISVSHWLRRDDCYVPVAVIGDISSVRFIDRRNPRRAGRWLVRGLGRAAVGQ